MKIDILGTEYEVVYKNYSEEPLFETRSIDGYCDDVEKVLCIGRLHTFPGYEDEEVPYCKCLEKRTLRHEIVHAFLDESGLKECAMKPDGSWEKNEEMVDWIALQLPKIVRACEAADVM